MLSLNDLNEAQEEILTEVQESYNNLRGMVLYSLQKRLLKPNRYDSPEFMQEMINNALLELQGMRRLLQNLGVFGFDDFWEEKKSIEEEIREIIEDDERMLPEFRGKLHV